MNSTQVVIMAMAAASAGVTAILYRLGGRVRTRNQRIWFWVGTALWIIAFMLAGSGN